MSKMDQLHALAEKGPFRASDAVSQGIPRSYLQRALDAGSIERISRGLYRQTGGEVTEMASVAEVAKLAPRAVICLLTALQFHELTEEAPHAVWIMLEGPRPAPKIDFVQTEVVRATGSAFHHGVEEHEIEGVKIRLTSGAKTVADCFRYRSHVGMEVAYSALRDYLRKVQERSHGYTVPALVEAAKVDRVYSVMRPSLEVLL